MSTPTVSVVMTVYNGSQYLDEALQSILLQTLEDFELIVVDDGSEDHSASIVERYNDSRIRLIRCNHAGLVKALNLGLFESRGKYIARMDADDRSHRDRLRRQVGFLELTTDISILCTDVTTIDGSGRVTGTQRQPGFDNRLARDGLLFRTPMKPIVHPSVMLRREVFDELGGYREFVYAEDHDLWLRAIDLFGFARLNELLLEYRIHGGGISRTKGAAQAAASAMSAVVYLVHRQTGVDIFNDLPEIFSSSASSVQYRLETEVLPPAYEFRAARLRMLTGNAISGWWQLLRTLSDHGIRALPHSTIEGTRRIVESAAASICETISEGLLVNTSLN